MKRNDHTCVLFELIHKIQEKFLKTGTKRMKIASQLSDLLYFYSYLVCCKKQKGASR